MRKDLVLAVLAAAAAYLPARAEYVTEGDFRTYTLDDLCAIEESGVIKIEGFYALTGDLRIEASDSLMINEPVDLRFANESTLSIAGYIGMSAADTIRVANYDAEEPSRSIFIDGGTGVFDKVAFNGLGIYNWSENPLTVTGCSFTGVTKEANSGAAVSFGISNKGNVVRGCVFTGNVVPAIGSSGLAYCGIGIYDCVLTDNNTENSNKPQINITTPAGNGPTVISGNIITGTGRNMVGGISVSNMMGGEMGDVEISGNTIRDHRYGINVLGPMAAVVKDNILIDNRYEANPMNGGSAISCTAFGGTESVVISGNHIEGSLWGVTLISYGFLYPSYGYSGFGMVSLGEPGNTEIDSPGLNVFVDNGNDGHNFDPTRPYDLYNNTDQTVFAQNNTWSVPEQTEEYVAMVIFDKEDDGRLGEVVYMPTHAGIGDVACDSADLRYDAASRAITGDGTVQVFTADGRQVLSGQGTVSTAGLPAGIYIAVTPAATLKFSLR